MIKVYKNGKDFLLENDKFLNDNYLEECFVRGNAMTLETFSTESYAIKVYNDNKTLIALRSIKGHPNLLIVGDDSLVDELVYHMVTLGLRFNEVLTNKKIYNKLVESYKKYYDCKFEIIHCMDIMTCIKPLNNKYELIENATLDDVSQIVEIKREFLKECGLTETVNKEEIINFIDNYYVIKEENEIISIAYISRETSFLKYISLVYTKKEHRNKGLSYKIVNYLTNKIYDSGKIATLYVDSNNPVSNHLYSKIGYTYQTPSVHGRIKFNNIKSCVLAGGCFWCMAKPYYEYEGIIKVYSGYCGGNEIFPTYKQVKAQQTSHKETVKLLYDSTKISYKEILKIYFDSIDPFDDEGQFIDKGESYKTAIFTNDIKELEIALGFIKDIENQFNRKVTVKIDNEKPFFMAEDYHQDFALKHPIEMEKELIESKRKEK